MDNNSQLLSAPIVPTASELETVNNPLAHIQAPDPILTPTIPSGIPPSIDINTLLQGDFNTGPNPAAKESNLLKNGTGDYANALFGKLQDPNLTKDEFKYGRTYSYGSGYKQQNFERYYSHNKFNKLGFSPYRDNEALYNEQGSWWDDFSRMSGQWLNLAYNGAKSVWGDSYEANQAMERGMAVGTSSKDGLGSWITNFGLNTAYTVGIIGELALENVALAAIEGATFGAASPLAEIKRLESFGKSGKALAGVGEFFKSLSSVEKAKAYYNAFNAGDKVADIAKFINPFENTTTFVHDLANGNSTVNKLKPLAKSVRGFGSFYRDIREINLTHAESAIEGEGVAAEINQQRLDQFYAENGRMPDEKEAKAIYDAAQAGKANSMLANNLVIYGTNKLVFDDLFAGLRPSSSAAKMASGLLEGSGRKMVTTAVKDLTKGVEGVLSENIFKTGERNFKDVLKDSIFKSHYSPLSSKYFYGNLGEALQETSQEVIRASAIEYDKMLSQDPSNIGYYATIGAIGKGVNDQFSQQGLDTFLSGYLMGSIIQGGGSALNKGLKTGKRAINSNWGKADEADAAVEETENNAINALNYVTKNALIYGKAVEANDRATMINILAKEKQKATKAGDVKTAQDLAGLMEFKYLDHVVRGGNVKALNAHIDEMLSLEDKDLSEAYGIDISKASEAREKLFNLKNKTEGFVNIYQKVRNEYPNPYKPEMFSEQKDGELVYKEQYENELTLYRAHEKMLTDIMYSNQYYTDISKRMTKLANSLTGSKFNNLVNYNPIGEAISNAAAEDISTLYDTVERKGRLNIIKEQVKILEQGDSKDKAEVKKLEKTIELLNEWDTAVDTFQVVNKLITKSGLIENIEDQKKALKEANSDLYKVFEKYIKNVAKIKKGHVMDSHVKEAFTELRDLLSLQGDRDNAVKTINALSNPEYLQRLVNTYAEVEKISLENKAQNLKIAIAEMKKRASSNKLLNELVDMGVYIVPEDFDDLEKDYKLVTFYDEASHSIIKPGTEKYKKIESIIRKYAKNAKVGGVKDYTDTFKEVKTFEELSILIEDLENQGIDLKPYQTIIESKTKEFETPSEVFTPAPEGIPTGKAMSKSFINKGKKFGFTLEQLETMSSEEKDLIRKANTKEDIKEIIEKYQDKKMNNTIEAKKVDIERKRQEEILDTFSPKISFEEFEKAWKKGIPVVPGTPLVDKSLTNILVDGKAYEYRYEKRSGKFYPIYPSSSLDAQSTERVEWLEKQALNINQLKGKELRKDLYQYHKGAASSLSKSDLVNYIKGTKREYILNEINVKYDTKLAALESIETQPVTEEIINEITIEQLKPGTSVTMKDNVEKIVYSNDGKNVTLLSPENFKSNKVQSKLILAKEIIKDKIKMIHTDLETEPAAEPVQPTPTPQERSESNSIVETAEADELTKTQNDIERVEGSKSDVVKQNLLDSIKKCDI